MKIPRKRLVTMVIALTEKIEVVEHVYVGKCEALYQVTEERDSALEKLVELMNDYQNMEADLSSLKRENELIKSLLDAGELAAEMAHIATENDQH